MRTFTPSDDVIIKLFNIPVLGSPKDCPKLTVQVILETIKNEMWRFPEEEQEWLLQQVEVYEDGYNENWRWAFYNLRSAVEKLYGIDYSESSEEENVSGIFSPKRFRR